jgi:hypothetical protein
MMLPGLTARTGPLLGSATMLVTLNLSVLRIVIGMLALAPSRGPLDLDFRWDLAAGIAEATDDPREQDVLTRIAWYESGFRRNVSRCEIRGDRGRSLGTFQVQPRTSAERRDACGSLTVQAALALRFVRDSAEACPGNVGADRLAVYVSGTCARGLRQSRERWGE